MTEDEAQELLQEITDKVNNLHHTSEEDKTLLYYQGFNHGLKMAMLIFGRKESDGS